MATKKAKKPSEMYVVLDVEDGHDAIVDRDSQSNTCVEGVIFEDEAYAIETADLALVDNQDFEDTNTLTVFKLVPVALVKRAKSVVEKL